MEELEAAREVQRAGQQRVHGGLLKVSQTQHGMMQSQAKKSVQTKIDTNILFQFLSV